MRVVFLLLCLINVAYLMWQFHIGALGSKRVKVLNAAELRLADEELRARRGAAISTVLDAKLERWLRDDAAAVVGRLRDNHSVRQGYPLIWVNKPLAVATAVKKAPAKPPEFCYEAGPFEDDTSSKQWLKKHDLSAGETLQKDVDVAGDFQVFYPAAKNPEQLRNNKALLNAKGITDIWPVPDGDFKGALSLGVFTDRQRATLFKSQLAQRGIQAEIRQRIKTVPRWYVRFMADKSRSRSIAASAELTPCSPPR